MLTVTDQRDFRKSRRLRSDLYLALLLTAGTWLCLMVRLLCRKTDNRFLGSREELSGGEIKRIELTRLLLRMERCSLLMLDEPFENLDEERRKVVHEILERPGRARILVSHGRK